MNMTEEQARERRLTRRLVIVAATCVMAVGCGMLIAAMAIPPPGEIDGSVLVAFGEISTFSGALLGIKTRNIL